MPFSPSARHSQAGQLADFWPARLSRRWWDFTDLLSWPDVKGNIRVVRSEESWTVKPQLILLLAFLAYNIFQAFIALNLKPEVRRGRTMEFWVRLIAAEISRPPALLPNGRATLTYAFVRQTRMLLKGFL